MTNKIINIAAIERLMLDPPKAQRLHDYFNGNRKAINDDQKRQVADIIEDELNSMRTEIWADILKS